MRRIAPIVNWQLLIANSYPTYLQNYSRLSWWKLPFYFCYRYWLPPNCLPASHAKFLTIRLLLFNLANSPPALERGRFCATSAEGAKKDFAAFAAVNRAPEFRRCSVLNVLQFVAAVSNAANPARESPPDSAISADTARRKKNASNAGRYFAEARQ